MLAWGFGDFKGGEIFPWRNYPLRNCPQAKFPPPLYYAVVCAHVFPLVGSGGGGVRYFLEACEEWGVGQFAWVVLTREAGWNVTQSGSTASGSTVVHQGASP